MDTGQPAPASQRASVMRALQDRIRDREQTTLEPALLRWPALAGQTVTLVVGVDRQDADLSWTFPAPPGQTPANGHATGNGHAAGNGQSPPEVTGHAVQEAEDGTHEPVATLIAGPQVWQAVLDGSANMMVEIRAGRMRCVNRRDARRWRSDEVHAVGWLLGLAQVPLFRAPA